MIKVIRLFTGAVYIFSGLVKAIDPVGLAYKMEEFFEAWSSSGIFPPLMNFLHGHSLSFSVVEPIIH